MTLIDESNALHARVQAFVTEPGAARFEEIALAIARFQARYSPGFARLVERHRSVLDRISAIPAVPVDAFRLTRVAVHPPELDEVRFETSGTTLQARGVHAMRSTHTYRKIALAFGRSALLRAARATVVALAPVPAVPCTSSLGFMMLAMMEEYDGRSIEAHAHFDARAANRWLVHADAIRTDLLEAAAESARERGEPLIVLATSFALVMLLDALGGRVLKLPERSVVMQTGGFKGRVREVASDILRRDTARAFAIDERSVVGEYGMTELTSQLYQFSAASHADRVSELYAPPSWLQVAAVHPETLEALPSGEPGLARFVDLGNVDSSVAIVSQDVVRVHEAGVELCGRRPGAPARGCSLAIEELLLGRG